MPRKKKTKAVPAVKRRYMDMKLTQGAIGLSTLGQPLRMLVKAVYEGDESGSGPYFNHGYDVDPATRGALPGDCKAAVYYIPATAEEIKSSGTIGNEGLLSGRRRLIAKVREGGYPDYEQQWTFYITSHPKSDPRLRTNVYGGFTAIDPAR